MTTIEISEEGKTCEDMLGWKDQDKTENKSEYLTWRDKAKDVGERKETQTISREGKVLLRKQDILKWRKKILQTSWWRMHKNKPTTRFKGNKKDWNKIWQHKEHYRMFYWINKMNYRDSKYSPWIAQSYTQENTELENASWYRHT